MLSNGLYDVPPGKVAMIVTHLEMRAQAPMREIALPEDVEFRQVTPDPDWYRDIFHRVGAEDWLWFGRLRKSDTELSDILTHDDVEVYTLCLAGRDEALLELDFRHENACELAYFGLTSPLVGSGCGRFLMNEAIRRAWSRPITRFHVHTCTLDSPQALAFYQRSGFIATHQQVEIDDDPRVTGLLPEQAGPHAPIFTG